MVIALSGVLIYKSCIDYNKEDASLLQSSGLIQEKIQNVAKLVVAEGHFAEVYTYKDSRELFGPMFTADKKALVVVNAEVQVQYDLKQMEYELVPEKKRVLLRKIPPPEIKIFPEFQYYDVTADYLNPFEAEDYNQIKQNVKTALAKKVENSNLKRNAQNRLVTELAQLQLLTQQMGWQLVYKNVPLNNFEELKQVIE